MTQDASPRLHIVTGNRVAGAPLADEQVAVEQAADDHVLADLVRRAEALDARVTAEWTPRVPSLLGLVVVGVALTVVLALLGSQHWELPQRDGGVVSALPQSLLTFVLLCAALCVWAAGRLVRPAETLRSTITAHIWWALLAGAALVSVAAALSLASFAGTGQLPPDLVLRGVVPVVPAVLAGLLARNDGRAARIRVALGTGLVTVPLGALGWALLSSPYWSTAGLTDVLAMTGLSALAPLALAVTFVAADRRGLRAR